MIDAVASDYLDDIGFVAVAQNSSEEASRDRVGAWFSPDRLLWGYSDEIAALFGVRGQPVSVLISEHGRVVDGWYGPLPEDQIRAKLDALAGRG